MQFGITIFFLYFRPFFGSPGVWIGIHGDSSRYAKLVLLELALYDVSDDLYQLFLDLHILMQCVHKSRVIQIANLKSDLSDSYFNLIRNRANRHEIQNCKSRLFYLLNYSQNLWMRSHSSLYNNINWIKCYWFNKYLPNG